MVLLDIDGVVLDLLKPIETYLLQNKGISVDLSGFKFYNFSDIDATVRKEIYACFNEEEVYKMQQYIGDAYKAVQLLKKVTEVRGYTKVAPIERLIRLREAQMMHMGIIGDIFNIDDNKKTYLGVEAIFEDCPENIRGYINTGTQIYMIDHSYNRQAELNRIGGIKESDFIRKRSLLSAVEAYINTLPDKRYRG